jgi:peptide/nickel transport system ATP-binding protein
MSHPAVELRGVQVHFAPSRPPAIVDIDMCVRPGESVGIVGESGSGKTTLGRVLVGGIVPTGGVALVAGRRWDTVRRKEPLRRSVQMVFQDPYASLNPRLSARDSVGEVFRVWDRDHWRRARERADGLLAEVGLASHAVVKRPRQLSGGQCQRVAIARALACEPTVLVADEPTSALDVSVQAQILNLFLDLRASRNLALVLISHDLGVVRYATDRAIVMYKGRIVEEGPSGRLLDAPEHDYTASLVRSIPGRHSQAPTAAPRRPPGATDGS